jgi:hypothetical protein
MGEPEQEVIEVKDEEDIKPPIVIGSGDDDDNGIKYVKTVHKGDGTAKNPWYFYEE